MLKKTIFSLFVVGMIATTISTTTSCGDEYFYDYDTIIFVNNVNVEGDSIVNDNHLHNSPEVDVNGGTTTVNGGNTNITTNGGENGGNGSDNSNSNITYGTTVTPVPNGYLITVKDPRALSTNIHSFSKLEETITMLSGFERRDIRDIERENPGKIVISAGYYDANSSPRTTLSFPAKFTFDDGKFVVDGTFGADDDRKEDLSALVWSETSWNVGGVKNYQNLLLPKAKNYLVGFEGHFGKSQDDPSGRLLVSTNNKGELLILVVTETTQTDAFHLIQKYGGRVCATLNGGGSVQYVNGNDRTDDDIVNHSKQVPLFLVISY